ncbi:T-complex protein 1 subunit delta [Loa loa]|uniref:T-complex protein 1 subunit delta n=1 Tax=Loa loa TaxID=7209 RepID=A0A1I7VCH4_LOALO|nr:T-complex protein 1 subunit delta [Loa loa]EFO19760.1 T-complex protein 1 subunit delta [Loa loa]
MAKTTIAPPTVPKKTPSLTFKDKDKPDSVRSSNIIAAKAVADAIRTSLGPKGMDKMIETGKGEVTITNDGATILKQMSVIHPAAKMLVELSKAQDIEAGDGTTTVVVIAGALLDGADKLLNKGIHPTTISESFQRASVQAEKILESMASPVDLDNDDQLAKIATTSLNSKVVSQHSWLLAPMAVNAVKKIINTDDNNVDLRMIKIVKKVGETVEESRLVDGALIDQRSMGRGGPTRVEKAQIGLIQFQLSPPKTDMENQVILSDYTQMDRALKEERTYLLDLCKQIKKAGCNVLLIQKSILRDAVNEMSLHFLAKMKIMVVKDIEREDIEFYSRILGCRPIASIDHFVPEALGSADLVEQISTGGEEKIIQVTGVQNPGQAVSVLIRGSNKLVLEEAERSIHDALCVIRCLVKKRALLPGGGAPEMEVAVQLRQLAQERSGAEQYCWRAFADALEQVPYTLAENAGLNPIATVTELRTQHANGKKNHGVNVRKGYVTDIREENVLQPLLVSSSAIKQAAECVRSILKIDDIVMAVR